MLTNLGSLLGKDTDCAIGLKKSQLCSEFERLAFGLVYIRPCVDIYFKRTLSPYFRNLPLLHITIRLHLTSRLLKFMQWLARKQYVLVVGKAI